jgi:hypothetical protein
MVSASIVTYSFTNIPLSPADVVYISLISTNTIQKHRVRSGFELRKVIDKQVYVTGVLMSHLEPVICNFFDLVHLTSFIPILILTAIISYTWSM